MSKPLTKKQISSVVTKELCKLKFSADNDAAKTEEADAEAYITGLVKAAVVQLGTNKPTTTTEQATGPKVSL